MNEYEAERAANIEKNKALLASLGLDDAPLIAKPTAKAKKAHTKSKKRKAGASLDSAEPSNKSTKVDTETAATDNDSVVPTRRSTRNAGKPRANYDESQAQAFHSSIAKSRTPQTINALPGVDSEGRLGNRLGKRTHSPKTFGAIPGIEVGTWWESRAACSNDAVHAPFVAGIAGSATVGAYSVALSGGYDDDVDLGYGFTYTGSGGRDLKGTKANPKNLRTAPQSRDQSFDNSMNAALKVSAETRKPVRVIRGFKLNSPYAPESGYRYDGLYIVEKAWLEPGLNKHGYKVCKFAFKRMGGQPPLSIDVVSEEREASKGRESSEEDTAEWYEDEV